MTFFFSDHAIKDLKNAENYYNDEQRCLGKEFLLEIRQALLNITNTPKTWQKIYKDVRRYSCERFPFIIIYRINTDTVEVIAIAHKRRRPGYWKKRLS
ncbi:MAG: type II toxin-antitoxin system RelE/ParE family toxin [Lentisphaeraceae bacterium]|nr:type II toxin-antitoxin system RelE/ParE family toxin [Lentisphaeraceae bacterium]